MAGFCFVSEHHLHGKAAAKKTGVRPIHIWWTRGDSNSRPLQCECNALPAALRAHKLPAYYNAGSNLCQAELFRLPADDALFSRRAGSFAESADTHREMGREEVRKPSRFCTGRKTGMENYGFPRTAGNSGWLSSRAATIPNSWGSSRKPSLCQRKTMDRRPQVANTTTWCCISRDSPG